MMLDTNLLYYLVTVGESSTLTDAANRLHISQQALGRSMRKIEEELQVTLFERSKNKIHLNSYGEIAVEHARKILAQIEEMENTIRTIEKQNRTISIGSCAPRPLYDVYKIVSSVLDTMRLSTEITTINELINGLYNETYQIIILPKKLNDKNIVCKLWGSEELYFSLPYNHPLVLKEKLSFESMDGETLLLYKNIGFWYDIVLSLMPNTHFIIEEDRNNFKKLIQRSDFVTFTTDLAIEDEGEQNNRVIKEIDNEEALAPFYCICLKKNLEKYKDIFFNFN